MKKFARPSISAFLRPAAVALTLTLACGPVPRVPGQEEEEPMRPGDASADNTPGGSSPESGTTTPGGGTITSGTGSTPRDSSGAFGDIPCAVGAILRSSCADCHGASPRFGAPMSLVRAADFRNRAKDGSRTVGQAVIARINDDAHPMPQPPAERLDATERATLTTWINQGSPALACTAPSTTPPGGPPAGTETTPIDPDVTCYELRAHAPAGKTFRYDVPNEPDLYHCFDFAPPWGTEKVHLVSWKPLIDNDKVIHHWILYNQSKAVTDGSAADCAGAHPSAAMVGGWAPGGQGAKLPADVGQDISGPGLTLEIHYNNAASTKQPDASGVQVCVTKKLRPHEAGIHWLGTELLLLPLGGTANGTCKPKNTQPVTIISSTPHMHKQGRHLTTKITRANGTVETLIDKPFDFNTQLSYPTPQVIMPGDSLTTTCQYGGPAFFGEGTNQEMCYNFVLAYPNGALSSGSALRLNGCTGL